MAKDNKAFMDKFVRFINTADANLGEELISPDAIFHVPGRPEPLKGLEGYMAIIGMMRRGFSDIQWAINDLVLDENKVAALFTMTGTHDGAFYGVPPTGKSINVKAINIYHLSDGKIVTEYGQPDLMGLMMQIGALPPPN
nr:ester cyclase [uncultured Mucilaginibacter sp.]